ncbi:MAG: lysine exporter LysO family protein [Firmicutes bacterium]|nr:lysine exporter LysO family protein [Bacillota bacterium]
MTDLILYLGVTVIGYIIGSKVRDSRDKLGWTGKVQTLAMMVLIVFMGMRMGSNAEIIANLSTIGLSAFVITVAVMICSIGAIFIARKLMGIDRYGDFKAAGTVQQEEKASEGHVEEAESKTGVNTMTLVIVGAVIAGMLIGYFVIRNLFAGNMDTFDNIAGLGIKTGLCILLVFVGMDLGIEGTVIDNFKKVGWRIFVFPAVVAVFSLVGAGIAGVIMGFSLKESLAIGAGYGWYSLAPGIIMDAGYLTASAVSFLHNVMRELFAILFIPVVAAKIGYIETTGMPGAAAMDVCLPIVEKSTKGDIAVYSFVSGVILSALVPVMVPLIIG